MLGKSVKNREKYITYALYIIPGFVLYLCLFVTPLILGIYYSTFDWNGFSKKRDFIGLGNYIDALTDDRFTSAILFNLRYSILLIISIIVISMVLALLLNKDLKARGFIRSVYFFTAVVSMLTASLIFNEIYFRAIPAVGDLLGIAALQKSVLSSPSTAIYGILFVHVWQGVAIPTVLFLAGLQTIPGEILESSLIDGASKWQQFWKITIPYLLPVVSVVLVLVLRDGLMVFDYIVGLTDGGPGGATTSIVMLVYRQGFEEMKFSFAIAEALMISVVLIAVSAFQMIVINRKSIED